MKFLKAGTIAAAIVFLGLEIVYLALWEGQFPHHWIMILPPLVLLWPAARWVRRQATRAVVTGDRLRYESGLVRNSRAPFSLPKSSNTIN